VSTLSAECIPHFARTRHGYNPVAVDQFIALLTQTQQSLSGDVQVLHAQLSESVREVGALKAEVATLYDTSSSPDAMTYRLSKLLQTAVDEVSQIRSEAHTQAATRVAAAKAEADQMLSEAKLNADMLMRDAKANAEKLLSKAKADAAQLQATAKINATVQVQKAQAMTQELAAHQISILEQLMAVYRTLDGVPAFLESAQRNKDNPATPLAHPDNAPTATDARCACTHLPAPQAIPTKAPNYRLGR
jgi:cell division septum initiation protein DivIVA